MRPTSITSRRGRWGQAGFTLMEMVITIILAGILAAGIAMFGNPIRGGIEAQRRAELADAADTAYRRMARDLRRALPNSIRLTTNGIEFIPTQDGGRYTDVTDGGDFLSFTHSSDQTFDVLGPMPSLVNNDYIVISNWNAGNANAYCAGDTCNNRAKVSISGNKVSMAANPFPSLGEDYASPGSRFHVISQTEKAVRYECTGGQLVRRWNYGFNGDATGATSAVLADNVQSCSFSYVQFDVDLWGLVHLQITMANNASLPGETITLVYQIHVDNTP